MTKPPNQHQVAASRGIGILVARFRERRGVSRAELARRVGLSSARLGIYEAGLARLDAAMLESLAAALGVGTAELLTVDDEFRP